MTNAQDHHAPSRWKRKPAITVLILSAAVGIWWLLLAGRATTEATSARPSDREIRETWTERSVQPARSLSELQSQIQAAIKKILPATVAVETARSAESASYEGFASGVLISPDGLVLSQHHVTHDETSRPGDERQVVLYDGRRLTARLLGADATLDISLLQIVGAKELPFAAARDGARVALGDYVLKLGHPGGYREGRPPVVRLGRVLYAGPTHSITDCAVTGGDSGGPYFSLKGELVGLASDSGGPYPIRITHASRRPFVQVQMTNMAPILRRLPEMKDGKLWDLDFDRVLAARAEYKDCTILAARDWSQGRESLAVWNPPCLNTRGSVVEVLLRNVPVALGTVVDDEGFVLTKASEIANAVQCRLADGTLVEARVVGFDPAFDLALLKLSGSGFDAIDFSGRETSEAGRLLTAPDHRGKPIAWGIVSVPTRDLAESAKVDFQFAPWTGAMPACRPEIVARRGSSGQIVVAHTEGNAERDGIRVGDVIRSCDGQTISDPQQIERLGVDRRVGDVIPMEVLRDGRRIEVHLQVEPIVKAKASPRIFSYRSFRRDHFPTVFEHNLPLGLDECGGPLVDLDGRFLGITIARVNDHGCMAIPANVIEELLPGLRRGEPMRELPTRSLDTDATR